MNMYDICLLHARSDRHLRASLASQFESLNITMMEWLLLGVLDRGSQKGCSMSTIAASLEVTLPQVTALVTKLLNLKLVTQKAAASDRRSRVVMLTSKGRQTLDEANKQVESARVHLFGEDNEEALKQYIAMLEKLSMA